MTTDRGESAPADSAGASAPAQSVPQSPGQMLRAERERRGLTLQKAADGLNLDRWIVEAIEVDHFLALGAPVYARGHLRKYAALLGLPQELIVDRYDALAGTPSAPVVSRTTTARMTWRPRRQRSYAKPLLWALLLIVVAAGGWWGFNHYGIFRSKLATSNQVTGTTTLTTAPGSSPGVLAPPLMVPPNASDSTTGAAGADANQSATAVSNQVSLRLEFSAPSFVEVVDATGHRLMFDNGRPGQPREMRGVAPLEVILSVGSAVSAQVNEHAVVIPRLPGKDATRFSVDANGTVR